MLKLNLKILVIYDGAEIGVSEYGWNLKIPKNIVIFSYQYKELNGSLTYKNSSLENELYPNYYKLKEFLIKNDKTIPENAIIVLMTIVEQTEEDYKTFCKNLN